MSRYADPTRCPNCGSYATGAQRCARCGLLLLGPRPDLLMRTLADADRVLDDLRAEALGWQRAQVHPAPQPPTTWTPYPAPARPTVRASGRTWTVGSTLLALGALCLMVAAFVFVSVSWGSLGLLGRTAVLGAVTATVGAAGAVVTKRRLRGSTEALWSVFLAMLMLDYVGARAYGLLGMASWPDGPTTLVLGVLVAVAAIAIGTAGLRVELRLWAAEIGAGIGVTIALGGCAESIPADVFWTAIVSVIAALGTAAAVRFAGLRYAAWYAVGLAALAQFAAISAALGATFAHSGIRALITHDGALQTVVASAMTCLLGAAAYSMLRKRRSAEAPRVATATTAIAVTPALALAYAPAAESVVGTQVVAAVVLAVLAVVGIASRGPWARGVRVTAVIAAVPPLALAAAWVSTAAAALVGTLTPVWSADVWTRTGPVDHALGPDWLALVVLVSISVTLAAIARYADLPVPMRVRTHLHWAAGWCALAGVFATTSLLSLPVLVVALIPLGAGLITVGAARRVTGELAGIALIVAASVIPVASPVASIVVWSVVIAGAAAIAATFRRGVVGTVAAGVAAAYLHLTVVGVADIAGSEGKTLQLSLIACVVAVGFAAQLLRVGGTRVCVEVVAAWFGFVALASGLVLPLGWQSAMFTTLGAACGVIALIRVDRRALAVVGGALTGVGYVLRLVASNVDVVEAYTVPFGVILLAVGYLAMRRSAQVRTSAALLPGLAMVLVPSLPAVLVDPTTLRGLLLGLAAAGVLGAGAWLKWQAPFIVGTALVALITVRHIGPYADAVPRWGLMALAGTVMLVVGVTWESRVREARSLASFVGAMR